MGETGHECWHIGPQPRGQLRVHQHPVAEGVVFPPQPYFKGTDSGIAAVPRCREKVKGRQRGREREREREMEREREREREGGKEGVRK